MTDSARPLRLSRRGALAGAAWSAPVVVAASAVPAFAASPTTALQLRPGTTTVVRGTSDDVDFFYDLRFAGMTVVVPSALQPGQLSLVVTFRPTTTGGPSDLQVVADPADETPVWTISPAVGGSSRTITLTYPAAVAAGQEVGVPGNVFLGAVQPTTAQSGTYVVTAIAPDLTASAQMFATSSPGARRARVRRP